MTSGPAMVLGQAKQIIRQHNGGTCYMCMASGCLLLSWAFNRITSAELLAAVEQDAADAAAETDGESPAEQ